MHLKSIKSFGFKSFADKIEINIKDGITAIVGPNGSGKSNILDAVRWVLGEQSIKSLRGKNGMTDVIFSGSQSRAASKQAWVSLTFDNEDKYLNSPFAEIEIKRIVYKNGENEYFINNSKVRLKDITDLFMDSGAGKESFNIISQGAVADIISSKPIERRAIFEEAAGVLKYKKRKETSLKKLEKTKDNLEKVTLVIDELSSSIEPLKIQKEKAVLYNEYTNKLSDIEIKLIANEITTANESVQKSKDELEMLNKKTLELESTSNKEISELEVNRLSIIKIDEEINKKQESIYELNNKISNFETQKQVINERKKHAPNQDNLAKIVLENKEKLLDLNNKFSTQKSILDQEQSTLDEQREKLNNSKEKYNSLQDDINLKNAYLTNTSLKLEQQRNLLSILEDNIASSSRLPYAVKNVLSNPRLRGIYNIISNLITVPDKYTTAIDIALGSSANIIVVKNESSATDAIAYLKENKLGRATFFPLNNIKEKSIEKSVLEELIKVKGFIGIASNLISFDEQFASVIKNQLGNIIIVEDIDTMHKVGKQFNYRYRIVSLDGEILHSGGLITGGANKNNNSNLKDKEKINEIKKLLESSKIKKQETEQNVLELSKESIKLKELIESLSIDIISKSESISIKTSNILNLEKEINELNRELETNNSSLDNELDQTLNKIIEDIYSLNKTLEETNLELDKLKSKKTDISTIISTLETENRQKNTIYNEHLKETKNLEIKINKMDLLLDNLLIQLNEDYELTYEAAASLGSLDIEIDNARLIVKDLKSKIRELGIVNIGAIEEYDRINERYEFLTTQRSDLENSITTLENLIVEMDEIMVTRFQETFNKIEIEFTNVFKLLFKGGKGLLKLTDQEDLLNSGIEIIAEPPGKKLNSIDLLSGGEKTLTAIALLFAILNIKTVPFCILDEVEAALDEANVDAFGKYLSDKKDKSQFIIITHKKKTMEYADCLYGITMQESGVSKLVSVKLEN